MTIPSAGERPDAYFGRQLISYTFLRPISFSICSSTPNRHDIRVLPNLQRVETELESLVALQHQGSGDIQELRYEIVALKEDVSTLLAGIL